ncbi:MAG: hypothetical protein H6888_12735 [Nitratireductor sp.]|nr:hypothetical protein [Nitratireductor sp.]
MVSANTALKKTGTSMASRKPDEENESRRILEEVKRDSESIGSSSLARMTDLHNRKRLPEDDADDPVVILGKKIGRWLGWITVAVLAVYLIATYAL